ncbi:PSD1 and planctomycete cytochrome C domain-containing protein [Verrucomicrobiales bacterium BCK34]|nr:PSD1 and planctomycete cytochrome C domain-containing protein [Verrucomicrobiales bacterium BCK34]
MSPSPFRYLCAALSAVCLPGQASLQADELEFFEKKIRPVLAGSCYKCHAADSEKLKGGLQVDHREHLLAGGETGAAIVPGDIEKSLLIESIRYHNEDLQMPPKEKLSQEIVKDFETWITAGAPWPDEPVPERDGEAAGEGFDLKQRFEEHWSWRPVEKPELPVVTKADWPRSDLDRFILKRVEDAGLEPAEEADRRTWLRRVYFDIIGLPPTLEQQTAFLSDTSDGAREAVIDELLASPHFGEKWARHWMDLVRYAETYGHEFDYPIAHAYRYRDYLIRAFNADVPYNDFIIEHIAGDLMEGPRRNPLDQTNESIQGTAFWYFHEATHAPTDVLGNEADIMDNQIDVFGKTFLGLTVACARCHDHKFDAISTADYYALTSYLHGSARQEVPLDPGRMREKTRSKLVALKQKADAMIDSGGTSPEKVAPIRDGETVFESFSDGKIPAGWSTSGFAFSGTGSKPGVRFSGDDSVSAPGKVDSGLYGEKQVGILRSPTYTIESEFIHLLVRGTAKEIRVIIDNYQMARFSGLLFNGTVKKDLDTEGKYQWITMRSELAKYGGHKAYLEFSDTDDGSLIIDEIRFSSSKEAPELPPVGGLPVLPAEALQIVEEGIKLEGALPKADFAVAMAQGTPEKAHVYVRGSHNSPGKEVPGRFLEALGGETGDRLFLANKVADPDNPLTSRVIVNRVWHYLFGRGLVASVDDFGPMGTAPSHPELLDFLASEFVEKGWSIKTLVREIVLSSTYRQSSELNPNVSPGYFAGADPDNLLLSKMPVKRLTGEAIRDSILAVSEELDATMSGPSVPTYRTQFMSGRGGKQSGPLDGDGRRSVYGAVYRNFLSPFMLTFDVPGPFGPKGRRSVSNVPAQALVLMNDPFVVEQSQKWAEKLGQSKADDDEVIRRVFLSALGRDPGESESERLEQFLKSEVQSGVTKVDALADLVHVVMNMKEFIFIH